MANLTLRHHHRPAKTKFWRAWLPVVALSWILTGCQSYEFDQTTPIEQSIWSYSKPINFEFDIKDTTYLYDIVLDITHTTSYAYQNVYCMTHVEFPNNQPAKLSKQLSLELADNVGTWYGKCSGEQCTIELAFMTQTGFDQLGKHKLTFEQYTREADLQGIESIRLRVIKTDIKKGSLSTQST